MNLRIPIIALCFAAIYLWVSCTVLLHNHDGEHSHTHCGAEDHSHTHEDDSCSICFFMQHSTAPLPDLLPQTQPHIQEYAAQVNEERTIQHISASILSQLNKGPPFLAV